MDPAEPTIHPVPEGVEPAIVVDRLVDPDRERPRGVNVVVLVTGDGNVGYAHVHDEDSPGHGSQRWLQHARRGSSPGGWSQLHHPRSEQHVDAWREQAAAPLDRLLIDCSKRAWKLEAEAPYVVESPPMDVASCGVCHPA